MEKEYIDFSEKGLKLNMKTIDGTTPPPWRGWHCHDAVELIAVEAGTLRIHIGGETLDAATGDLVLVNGEVPHCLEADTLPVFTYLQIESEQYSEFPHSFPHSLLYAFASRRDCVPYYRCREDDEIGQLFCAVRRELSAQDAFYERCVSAYIHALIALMHRRWLIAEPNRDTVQKLEKILQLARIIDTEYAQSLSLSALAERTGYNKFELCRRFKDATGHTVVEYINYVRLYHARQRLKHSSADITEIAGECGFSSVPYFSKVFKKYNGCSPAAYKKQSL